MSEEAILLASISMQISGLQKSLDKFSEILEKFIPALEKAAVIVDSPMAKVARAARAPWRQ